MIRLSFIPIEQWRHREEVRKISLLVAVAKYLLKATLRFVMLIHPSAFNSSAPAEIILLWPLIMGILLKPVEKIQFQLKSYTNDVRIT